MTETSSQYSNETELSTQEQSVPAAIQTITISRSVISESPRSRSIVNEPFRVQSLQEPAQPGIYINTYKILLLSEKTNFLKKK